MAVIYIISDKYLDEVSYAAGDTISVNAGITLTVRKSNTVFPATIITTAGELFIDAFADGAVLPIILTTSGISCTGAGVMRTDGDWLSLGTGDGTAGQTFTHIHPHAPPFVEIETAAGSGEYLACICIHNNAFTLFGAGNVLGRVFQYTEASSAIVFGNSTNGVVVPNGSNVRIPNIFITADVVWSTTKKELTLSNTGSMVLSKTSFSDRYRIFAQYCFLAEVADVGTVNMICGYSPGVIALTRFRQSLDYQRSVGMDLTSAQDVTITDSVFMTYRGAAAGGSYIAKLTVNDSDFYCVDRVSSNATFGPGSSGTHTFTNIKVIGGKLAIAGTDFTINGLMHSDQCTGIKSTAYAYEMPAISAVTVTGATIQNVSLLSGGSPTYSYFVITYNSTDISITNIDYPGDTHTSGIISVAYGGNNILIGDAYFGTLRSSLGGGNSIVTDVRFKNIKLDTATTAIVLGGNKFIVDGVTSAYTAGSTTAGSQNVFPALLYDAGLIPTSGWIVNTFGNDDPALISTVITSGVPYFNNNGTWYLNTSEQIEYTFIRPIYGVTAFANAAPNIGALAPANFTVKYKLKLDNGEWSVDWLVLSAANLTAESIPSADTKIYLKYQITSASNSNNIYRVAIPVVVDGTYVFPLFTSTLQINSMVSGSMVKVSKTSDETVLYAGSATSIEVEYAGEVRVVIRKGTGSPAYKQWDTIVTLVSGETTAITALQELDE